MTTTCVFLRFRLSTVAALGFLLVIGCTREDAQEDAGQRGVDAGERANAGERDGGLAVECEVEPDASPSDAANDAEPTVDTDAAADAAVDSGVDTDVDAALDAATVDASEPDSVSCPPDAGTDPTQAGDAAVEDAGPIEDATAGEDASEGSDAGPSEDAGPELSGWFVDSIGGSDDNDGQSIVTPFATLKKLRASPVKTGDEIHLKRGSLFREELLGLPANIVVRAYGDGARPIIDGSDIAPNASFQKSEGFTNLFQIAWTHEFDLDGGKSAHRVWEDGVRLRRVPDLATCEATPGSFFAAEPTRGGPDTVYVHASDSSAIATNTRVYELSRRRAAIQLYTYSNHASVYSIHTRRNAYADGSLVVDGLISDCLAEDGRVHNVLLRGTCENSTAWKIEPPSLFGGATMFVSYEDRYDVPQVTYRGCKAIADPDALGPTGVPNSELTLGFYGHTSRGWRFGRAIYEECEASGVVLGFSFQNVLDALYYKCSASVSSIVAGGTPDRTLAILGGTFQTVLDGSTLIKVTTDYQIPKKVFIRGVRMASAGGHNHPVWINRAGGYTEVTRSTFLLRGGGIFWLQKGTFVMRNNIFAGSNSILRVYSTDIDYMSDQNVYFNTNRDTPETLIFQRDLGPLIYGLPAWQTETGQDANSLLVDPMFVGQPFEGNFAIDPASPARALQAGADIQREEDDGVLQSYRHALMSGAGL